MQIGWSILLIIHGILAVLLLGAITHQAIAAAWPVAKRAPGFFWCVGQGGYGIQTSPAAGRFVADVIAGRDPGEAASVLPAVDPGRFG